VRELHRAKKGIAAALVTCLVEALNESDASFQARFLPNKKRHTTRFETILTGNVTQELELANWTRECLTEHDHWTGQAVLDGL
jgi:hypothetical protein